MRLVISDATSNKQQLAHTRVRKSTLKHAVKLPESWLDEKPGLRNHVFIYFNKGINNYDTGIENNVKIDSNPTCLKSYFHVSCQNVFIYC